MSIRLNKKGFSLVETVVAAGLLAGLSLFIVKLLKQSNKTTTKLDYKTDLNLISTEMNSILQDPKSCTKTFTGVTGLFPTNLQKIEPKSSPMVFHSKFKTITGGSPTNGYGNIRIHISSYELAGALIANTKSEHSLIIKFKNKSILKGSGGADLIIRRIQIYTEVNASGTLTLCRAVSAQKNTIWTRGEGANIYYSGGSGGAPGHPATVRVGIGKINPTTMLDVNGIISAKAHLFSSDRRLKKDIEKISNIYQRVLKLEGVMYKWKYFKNRELKNKKQLGLIAQDVEKLFPEAVITDRKTGFKSVAYANLLAPLLETIKLQNLELKNIKQRILKIKY